MYVSVLLITGNIFKLASKQHRLLVNTDLYLGSIFRNRSQYGEVDSEIALQQDFR